MNPSLQELKTTLSTLPEAERAELAQYLFETLGNTEESIRKEWIELAERRMADIRAGLVVGIPAEQVLESLRRPRP